MKKFIGMVAALITVGSVSAHAQSPVPVPGAMPKPSVNAPSTSGSANSNEATKQLGNQAAPQRQADTQYSDRAAQQNRQNSIPNESTQQNALQNGGTEQQRASQQSQMQQQQPSQTSGNIQNQNSDRSTFSQNRNDANLRDERQSTGGLAAQQHTANRANDLRAPDIGLWFDRGTRDGLVISDISNKGAIAKVGFREGDRIVSVNGHRVSREADFIQYLLSNTTSTTPVEVVVTRDGRDESVQVDSSLLLQDYGYADQVDPLEQFGIVVDDRYNDRIVVWRVIPRTPAYYAGFRAGDVITTFQDQPVTTTQSFEQTVVGANPGEVAVQVRRGDRTRNLSVDIPRFEQRGERRTALRPNLEQRNSYDPNAVKSQADENRSDSPRDANATEQLHQPGNQQDYRSNRDSGGRRGMFRGNR